VPSTCLSGLAFTKVAAAPSPGPILATSGLGRRGWH
jgi:hypothetical protein